MKKLGLIIPLSFVPPFLKTSFLILVMALVPRSLYADRYGCFVETYPFYIFHNEYTAMGGNPNYLFSSDANNNPDTYYIRNGRCPLADQIPCYLYNFNGTLKAVGYVTDFSIDNCPIDDYIPLLFIFTAGIAFFQIRKRQASIKDENLHHYRSL